MLPLQNNDRYVFRFARQTFWALVFFWVLAMGGVFVMIVQAACVFQSNRNITYGLYALAVSVIFALIFLECRYLNPELGVAAKEAKQCTQATQFDGL